MPGQSVTIDNFTRAETDNYFARHAMIAGGTGRLFHITEPSPVEHQSVIRMNRDTLYSAAVFDLSTPATIVFPKTGGRFMSMMVVNQDHYIKYVTYEPGEHTLTQEAMGTRYAEAIFRVFVDSDNPADIQQANALQHSIEIRQQALGALELPAWDSESLDACRAAILPLAAFAPSLDHTFGDVNEVDPVRHFVGTAIGWGGNRQADAMYDVVVPAQNDGTTPHVLKVKDVPVDGFWSISVYNAQGYFEPNDAGAYSLNNVTATPDADGGFTVHFGGDPQASNFLAICPGWNYLARMYRPRAAILDRSWAFPQAAPVEA